MMEQIMNQLASSRDASTNLKEAAKEAYNLLDCQFNSIRASPLELRHKCMLPLKTAFESKSHKLLMLSVLGFQKFLRDDRFHANYESDQDGLTLPEELLNAVKPILNHPIDVQIETLKVLLNLACCDYWALDTSNVMEVLNICDNLYPNGTQALKIACQSTACQMIRSYVALKGNDDTQATKPIDDIIIISEHISMKIAEKHKLLGPSSLILYLECLHTVISSVPISYQSNPVLISYCWKELGPSLMGFLGWPKLDEKYKTLKFDMESISSPPSFSSPEARILYLITLDLTHLMGNVGALRPVLESIFYRIFLYPPPQYRLDVLRNFRELFSIQENIFCVAGPIMYCDDKNPIQADLSLLRLIIDALEECCMTSTHSSIDTSLCMEVISCVVNLLENLEKFCRGFGLSDTAITLINKTYPHLDDSDYKGPLTYEAKTKLPRLSFHDGPGLENNETQILSSESSDTEGPEPDESPAILQDESSVEIMNDDKETERREKLVANLQEISEARMRKIQDQFLEQERLNAHHYMSKLKQRLPYMFECKSCIEVDIAFQKFSSQYCDDFYNSYSIKEDGNPYVSIINADGIYLATYSALLFNLKLIRNNYYSNNSCRIPITEEMFIEEVMGSGILVYLSSAWLAELYQQILINNVLEEAGYEPSNNMNCPLINLLQDSEFGLCSRDVSGLANCEEGSQLLSDYRRLERATANICRKPEVEAGMKLARRILTCIWDSMMKILSTLLESSKIDLTTSIGLLLGYKKAKKEQKDIRQAISLSLDGLQRAANLSNILGLQNRCGLVFQLLASASCPTQSFHVKNQEIDKPRKFSLGVKTNQKSVRLHASHVLSMDAILSRGLELGSHSSDCWKFVLRVCIYLSELESKWFSKGDSGFSSLKPFHKDTQNGYKFNFNEDEDDATYQLPTLPNSPIPECIDVPLLVRESKAEALSNGIISGDYISKILCGLSHLADRLFDDAASKLNMKALLGFLKELATASQKQLFVKSTDRVWSFLYGNGLLLHRMGEVVLKCVKSGRPLLHVMKAWNVVVPHFMEAACHKDCCIAKKSVSCIHDIVSALLTHQSELPHFHFCEALFKPFESLICLDLCDLDLQDQIISSICQFVESNTSEIRSGWRPLFGAIRAIKIPSCDRNSTETSSVQLTSVIDVFEAFLSTENVLVFANAAVDCIMCLLKHVQGPIEYQVIGEKKCEDGVITISPPMSPKTTGYNDMCLAALQYIQRCHLILSSVYQMTSSPVFQAASRIKLNTQPNVVDPVVSTLDVIHFQFKPIDEGNDVSYAALTFKRPFVSLDQLDNHTGILHVWYLLLEGLAGTTAVCPKKYQPHCLQALFDCFESLVDVPGPRFGLHCVNHLLLPMVQGWLRRTARIFRGWDNFAPNFKQCCGLVTDLSVKYFSKLKDESCFEENEDGLLLMLQQLLLVMIECVAQPVESISRLGCACIRHFVTSTKEMLTPSMWEVVCVALHRSCQVSVNSLKQLMVCFNPHSDNFYGDIGQVKVAARRDCTQRERERLQEIAQQVFLLDSQRSEYVPDECYPEEDRSYVFLLYPPDIESTMNPDLYIIRIPFRNVVVGLLAHQLLLQIIGSILLDGTNMMVPGLANILLGGTEKGAKKLPGVMDRLTLPQVDILLNTLQFSYRIALEFDLRPGLKFLMLKVAQTEVAPNMYKTAGASWTIMAVTLFSLCLNRIMDERLSLEDIREVLSSHPQGCQVPDNLVGYIQRLREWFGALCSIYIEMVLDKEGQYSVVDRIADQPLFFLTAQLDDIKIKPVRHSVGESESEFSEKRTEKPLEEELEVKETTSDVIQEEQHKTTDDDSSSDDDDPALHEVARYEEEEQVYSIATEHDITQMMDEYLKRKNQRGMPSQNKKHPFISCDRRPSDDPLSIDLEKQREKSITKDSEAHLLVWTEMIVSMFDLLTQLDEDYFRILLPVLFPDIRRLTAHAASPILKQTLSEFFQRVATIYGFGQE